MIEIVFALLLVQDHKIIEHRYYESLQKCLKGKLNSLREDPVKGMHQLLQI